MADKKKSQTSTTCVKLTDKLFLTMDTYNYILKEEAVNKKTGKTIARTIGYYYDLESLAKATVKHDVMDSEAYTVAEDLKDLVAIVKGSTEQIVDNLKDLGLHENILKKY